MTNADYIRAMSDAELATHIWEYLDSEDVVFCQDLPECSEMGASPSEERCIACVLQWLQRPVKGA